MPARTAWTRIERSSQRPGRGQALTDDIHSLWDFDGGEAARCYASKPCCHYKEEVYPLFADLLAALPPGSRALDVGAGPGHMAVEFYRAHPGSDLTFGLAEVGRAMLDIAEERLAELGRAAETFQRDFNRPDWTEGLGAYNAVVSNNAIFHVKPERLGGFYAELHGLLKADGLVLNQQSCAYESEDFKGALEGFPDALSPLGMLSAEKVEQWEKARPRQKELSAAALEKMRAELESRGVTPTSSPSDGAYANLHLPASAHVAHMQAAGFAAGVIWRKMEFVVLAGIKGSPFAE